MAPWSLIALLAGTGPERTAAIQGFWKALLPGKGSHCVPKDNTSSLPNLTALSKWSQLVHTTSPLPFQSSGVIGLVNSTPDMVVEVV